MGNSSTLISANVRKAFFTIPLFLLFLFYANSSIGQVANATCNTKSPWINGTYTNLSASITNSVASTIPLCVGSISNETNLVNASLTDNATISITGVGCDGEISVKDGDAADTYPAGTFAGFKVSSAGLLQASIGATVTITTYNNGSVAETYNAVTSSIGVNSSLLDANGNVILGFVTTADFDEIRIKYSAILGVLFTAQVYYAVIEKYCSGPALVCNTQANQTNPDFPVDINASNTGLSGLACVGCSITNTENILSSSTTDYGTVVLAAAVGTTASVSVKNQLDDYTAGTLAGFTISNPNLVNANLLSGITLKTYLNGTLQETSNSGTLLSVNSALLTGSGSQLVGMITTLPFDEVKIEITNLLSLISTTNIYSMVVQKLCAGPSLTCEPMGLITPTFPAVIDGALTGISGAACVACAINNTNNVVDNNTSNYAEIVITTGLISSGSIAVKDAITDYPIGTFAGFDVENTSLLGLSLLNNATITTYLNGVQQETSGGNLISLKLLSSTRQIIGFTTTKDFDEIKLTVSNLVGIDVGTTNVFQAILKKATSAGNTAPTLSSTTGANTCPTSTFNLNSLVSSSTPSGASLLWFTNATHTAPSVTDPTIATAGTYYAYYYDSANDCYSPASGAVTVTISSCCVAGNDAPKW